MSVRRIFTAGLAAALVAGSAVATQASAHSSAPASGSIVTAYEPNRGTYPPPPIDHWGSENTVGAWFSFTGNAVDQWTGDETPTPTTSRSMSFRLSPDKVSDTQEMTPIMWEEQGLYLQGRITATQLPGPQRRVSFSGSFHLFQEINGRWMNTGNRGFDHIVRDVTGCHYDCTLRDYGSIPENQHHARSSASFYMNVANRGSAVEPPRDVDPPQGPNPTNPVRPPRNPGEPPRDLP